MELEQFAKLHSAERAAWAEYMAASDDAALLKRLKERGSTEVAADEELATAEARSLEAAKNWSAATDNARRAFAALFEPVGIKSSELYSYTR